VQCLSDTGHKDAPSRLGRPTRPEAIRRLIKQALAENVPLVNGRDVAEKSGLADVLAISTASSQRSTQICTDLGSGQ
jgi:hypothetical protein